MNLSYKLCKSLKEAGYPQELGDGTEFYDLGGGYHKWDYYSDKSYKLSKEGYYKIPTLEGLIENCGDELIKLLQDRVNKIWIATADTKSGLHIVTEGCKTPKEAVCKLYIELRAKK